MIFQRMEIFTFVLQGDLEEIQLLLNENIVSILFITLVMMVLQNSFTIIPLILLITLNIMLFGFIYGILWSWMTSIIAAVIVFISVRYFFQDLLLKRINEAFKEKIEKNGLLFVFIGRIFPFMPTSMVNIIAGVSSIQFIHFLIATSVGNLLFFSLLGLIPLGIVTLEVDYYILGIFSFIIILAYYLYKYYFKKNPKQMVN
ncbi:VTT domain-containing protein [Bacillaceae bacterium IKA-2]|nr:VTT domain-containing protein [Bacillaceae bacterium IKA-2]